MLNFVVTLVMKGTQNDFISSISASQHTLSLWYFSTPFLEFHVYPPLLTLLLHDDDDDDARHLSQISAFFHNSTLPTTTTSANYPTTQDHSACQPYSLCQRDNATQPPQQLLTPNHNLLTLNNHHILHQQPLLISSATSPIHLLQCTLYSLQHRQNPMIRPLPSTRTSTGHSLLHFSWEQFSQACPHTSPRHHPRTGHHQLH